jgi:hypothetical protein
VLFVDEVPPPTLLAAAQSSCTEQRRPLPKAERHCSSTLYRTLRKYFLSRCWNDGFFCVCPTTTVEED